LAVCVLLPFAVAPSSEGEEPCLDCDAPKFPEAEAFLETQGFPSAEYTVLLAWTESAPAAPGGFVAGYRVKPVNGGEAFDLYASTEGEGADEARAAADWGVPVKSWDMKPVTVEAEAATAGAEGVSPSPVPVPASMGLKRAPEAVTLPPVDREAILEEDR